MKEHCLMGIKGTVRRSTDGHIIHANIDTDVIIAEEPPYGQCISSLKFLALVGMSPHNYTCVWFVNDLD
jgi:hypothetical protein